MIILGVIVVTILGYLGYIRYIQEPKEKNAADELAFPKAYFDQAIAMEIPSDSLFTLALNGDGVKSGLIDLIDQYGNTKAGNLAKYYAGISYLKMADYKKAIEYLDEFTSEDMMLGPVAKGAIGDAFIDLEKPEEALKYYQEAYQLNPNDFTTPKFLNKAAQTAMMLKEYEKAVELYQQIKDEYPFSAEAQDIDAKINQAKYSK